MTRVAIDIHRSDDLADHQRALVKIGISGRTDRVALKPYLTERSQTFRALSDPQDFWAVLLCNCLSGQNTDAIHWLYNIVLGFDWEWHLSEQEILERLGLKCP